MFSGNFEYFSVGWDVDFQDDGVREEVVDLGPTNKRPCPCDTCSFNLRCYVDESTCKAVRTWFRYGDYKDRDLKRRMKEDTDDA